MQFAMLYRSSYHCWLTTTKDNDTLELSLRLLRARAAVERGADYSVRSRSIEILANACTLM
jgi:hypothetical protein